MNYPLELILCIQETLKKRNKQVQHSLEWNKYEDLFLNYIYELAFLFTKKENQVYTVEKFSEQGPY